MKWLITADEHYGHTNIIKYTNRPFADKYEMNEVMIRNHNSKATDNTITIHAGDFAMGSPKTAYEIINKLKGRHVFLRGSHDSWMRSGADRLVTSPKFNYPAILESAYVNDVLIFEYKDYTIVVSHYAMRVWPKSHFNSWLLYGHTHGRLEALGKSHDVGVDNNGFMPLFDEEIVQLMSKRPNNPNYLGDEILRQRRDRPEKHENGNHEHPYDQ